MKTATLVLIVQNGRVLLGEKKHGEIGTGVMSGPGGKLEPDETLVECAVRETQEEFGIELIPDALTQVARIVFHAGGTADFNVHIFIATDFRGIPRETEDMLQPTWYALGALPLDQMYDSDRVWFPKALAGERFSANVYYRERAKGLERIEFLPPDF